MNNILVKDDILPFCREFDKGIADSLPFLFMGEYRAPRPVFRDIYHPYDFVGVRCYEFFNKESFRREIKAHLDHFINNRCAVEIEFRQICAYNIQCSVCDADNKMSAFHIGYA